MCSIITIKEVDDDIKLTVYPNFKMVFQTYNDVFARPMSQSGRPLSGFVRPGTQSARPGTMEQALRSSRTAGTAR